MAWAATLVLWAALATAGGCDCRAADGRELLTNAIANTRGSYPVYNFGGGAPAPLLNAGGGWYELSNGGHLMIIKSASQRLAPGAPYVVSPKHQHDYDAATPAIQPLLDNGTRFVAVSGIGLLAPGDTGQLNDGGPSAARTAIAYSRDKDEMYVFQGAATHRIKSRTCSGASGATPRFCSTAAGLLRCLPSWLAFN